MKYRRANLRGPRPPDDYTGDGCTMVPDGWWREACRWHDWHYSGQVAIGRLRADIYFFCNLVICGQPAQLAWVYFRGVRRCGWKFYKKYQPT